MFYCDNMPLCNRWGYSVWSLEVNWTYLTWIQLAPKVYSWTSKRPATMRQSSRKQHQTKPTTWSTLTKTIFNTKTYWNNSSLPVQLFMFFGFISAVRLRFKEITARKPLAIYFGAFSLQLVTRSNAVTKCWSKRNSSRRLEDVELRSCTKLLFFFFFWKHFFHFLALSPVCSAKVGVLLIGAFGEPWGHRGGPFDDREPRWLWVKSDSFFWDSIW